MAGDYAGTSYCAQQVAPLAQPQPGVSASSLQLIVVILKKGKVWLATDA
jgi:hypothetical protein